MTPDVVVDIGNSRMKWGLCEGNRVSEVRRLSLHDLAAWDAEFAKLPPRPSAYQWAVASVNPPALARFREWLNPRGITVLFENSSDLPIRTNVDEPAKVGIDRLFGALAARSMVPPGTAAITVDVGTAVTVNLIDSDGVFQGGAIFPGPRLMGRALHEHTAKLPLIDPTECPMNDSYPAKNTTAAIRIGIDAALAGGINQLVCLFAGNCPSPPWLFLTGGGRHLLDGYAQLGFGATPAANVLTIPVLTLEGIRIAAEALS